MALSKAEWRKRVAAAAALHGLDLSDLDDLKAGDSNGVPLGAARRAGHESDDYMPNHTLALVLAERLDVPVAWFEDEDWRPLLQVEYVAPPEMQDGIRRQKEGLEMMREGLTRLRSIETRLDLLEVPESEAEQPATKADLQSAAFELSADVAALHKEIEAVRRTQGRGAGGRASG